MDRAELETALRASCPSIAERVIARIEPCVALDVARVDDTDVPLGHSKIGGAPDLPSDLEWPTWVRHEKSLSRPGRATPRPLDFLAQVDLSSVAGFAAADGLPGRGILLFFADVEASAGLYPEDRDGFRVLWIDAAGGLARRTPPDGSETYACGVVTAREAVSVPPPGSSGLGLEGIDVPDEEADALDEIAEGSATAGGTRGAHQLLGHAGFIQHPVEEEVVQGISGCFSGPDPFDTETWTRVQHETASWRLLLQIDSDDTLDLMWGDVGRLYFAIRRDALARPDSAHAWFNFQCS